MMRVNRNKWERAVWLVSNELAEAHGSLPHEERWPAVEAIRSFEEDAGRDTNRPRLKALLTAHGLV